MRTRVSYTAESPWGWYFFRTSPTMPAHFEYARVDSKTLAVHRVEHAAVDRLETRRGRREARADDDGHRIVHIGPLHLVFDVDRQSFRRCGHVVSLFLAR